MPDKIIVSAPGPQGPAGAGGAGGVSDGDKGDITVASSGTSWTIDANAISTAKIADDAVTFAKVQNVTGPTLLGRQTGTGSTEQIGLAAAFTINGSKQLDLANALAASSTTLTAGTGLTGGGDLSANRTFSVAYGTTSGTSCQGNDSRLSDARTPTAHTHALADLQQGGATSGQVIEWNGTAWAPTSITGSSGGTVTSVTGGTGLTGGTITTSGTLNVAYGSTAGTACEGNDARLSDARTPTEHTHYAPQSYVGHIETPTARTYYVDLYAPALTITSLRFKTSSGTVDVTVYNGASQVYTADGLGTTRTDVTSGLSNTAVSAGGTISLVVDAVSTPADLQFVIAYTASTGGVE